MIYLVQYLHKDDRSWISKVLEPWKTTVASAISLVVSMVVLVFGLYGPWICGSALLVIAVMGSLAWCAFGRLKPDHVFEEVNEWYKEAMARELASESPGARASRQDRESVS